MSSPNRAGRNRRRAILAKRYPSPRGPFPTDERSHAQLVVTPGPIRSRDGASPAERLRELTDHHALQRELGRQSMPWRPAPILASGLPQPTPPRAAGAPLGSRRTLAAWRD